MSTQLLGNPKMLAVCCVVAVWATGCGGPDARAECEGQSCDVDATGVEQAASREVTTRFSSSDKAYIEKLTNCEVVNFKATRNDGHFTFTKADTTELPMNSGFAVFDATGKMSSPNDPTGFDSEFRVTVQYKCRSARGKTYRTGGRSVMWYDDELP